MNMTIGDMVKVLHAKVLRGEDRLDRGREFRL